MVENTKKVMISMDKEDSKYLKRHGMVRSKFLRQAIKAHKDRKWNYEFISIEEENE